MKFIRRLYDWTLSLAARPGAIWALFAIAVAESSFFPIPPDVLLIAMTLAQPAKGLWYATICTAGSVTGALFGYLIGYAFWAAVGGYFFKYVPGFTPEIFAQVCKSYEQYSVLIVFTAAFTPIPYKVITITAGVSHISVLPFIVASICGRAGRFFLVSGLLMKFGPRMKEFIEKYFNLLTVLVVVIYVLAFYLLPVLFK